ncbi:type I 3-dehydroquinate dehydratase [Candidatus Pantoea deserta]|uniref:3-dehydroquinate dehydratase n=1 Tax=Candidatus Pantoea deserta TaxID=1869313 RepID=A0A3N4NEA4_9GAMM|nr:type I 3-dehydroquinate dehydratase [Pantoea deserta]RPD94654.1 type I 3-dehydroquinate dehydratase [Pantoea deserta]
MLRTPLALLMMMAVSAAGAEPPSSQVRPLQVGNLTIQQGKPAIIISTTGADSESALALARQAAQTPQVQMVELRVDKLDFATDVDKVTQLGQAMRRELNGKPLLLTLRTEAEGGSLSPDDASYIALYQQWLAAGFADLIDIEMRIGAQAVDRLVAQAHQRHVAVILSYHDFKATPDNAEMLRRLTWQEAHGADILKIAVMPQTAQDVSRLMDITWQIRQRSDKPLLTMAMGGLGAVTRLSGEIFGSNLTFGTPGEASAPGQLEVQALDQALNTLHKANASSSSD